MKLFIVLIQLAILVQLIRCQYVPQAQLVFEKFKELTKSSNWTLVSKTQLKFDIQHPQGMLRINDYFYMTTVNKATSSDERKFGQGYLLKFDINGNLINQVLLANGNVFHPGGIDYDGQFIWVPVAEYRPFSSAIVITVDPDTFEIQEKFTFNDHLSAFIFNSWSQSLHGYSWGARNKYQWKMTKKGKKWEIINPKDFKNETNHNFYIDYQDCHYLFENYAVCNGLQTYNTVSEEFPKVQIGGDELIDVMKNLPIHQIPVPMYLVNGQTFARNPFFVDLDENNILRFYYVPEDLQGNLWIFNAQ